MVTGIFFANFDVLFISLLAQRNEPKKGQPITWTRCAGLPYAPGLGRARKNSGLRPSDSFLAFSGRSGVAAAA